jgi:TM2 domain-containing membrane protein YozV
MADAGIERPRFCSQCGNPVVVADANFCKECGAPLAGTVWLSHGITWRPFTALMLSVVPGLGQFYKGQRRKALAWFLGVIIAYCASAGLGLLLHLICAFNAAFSGAIREEALSRSGRTAGSQNLTATARSRT